MKSVSRHPNYRKCLTTHADQSKSHWPSEIILAPMSESTRHNLIATDTFFNSMFCFTLFLILMSHQVFGCSAVLPSESIWGTAQLPVIINRTIFFCELLSASWSPSGSSPIFYSRKLFFVRKSLTSSCKSKLATNHSVILVCIHHPHTLVKIKLRFRFQLYKGRYKHRNSWARN